MIKQVKEGYAVLSTKGRNLGAPYKTLEEAKKRLQQVESLNIATAFTPVDHKRKRRSEPAQS